MNNRFSILVLAGLTLAACGQKPVDGAGENGSKAQPTPAAVTNGVVRNAGFEDGVKDPWTANVHANPDAYQFEVVSDVVASGSHAVRIRGDGSEPWGGLMQYLSKPGLAGQRVVLSASVKGDNVPGGVQMLAVFRNNPAMPFEHNFTDLGASFDWRRIEQEFDVPANAGDIEIGLMQLGGGTLWVDDITLVAK
jgi:hypothetical protein